jgi:hypothetical protein
MSAAVMIASAEPTNLNYFTVVDDNRTSYTYYRTLLAPPPGAAPGIVWVYGPAAAGGSPAPQLANDATGAVVFRRLGPGLPPTVAVLLRPALPPIWPGPVLPIGWQGPSAPGEGLFVYAQSGYTQ